MAKIQVKNKENNKVKDIELAKEIFDYPVKPHLMWEVVKSHQRNQRKGSAATKTRSMVRGGGRKPWPQKGRGAARAGSIRSPLWRHGGVTFGPQPKNYYKKIPTTMKRNALKSALVAKYNDKEMIIIDKLNISKPKTKLAKKILDKFKIESALIVDTSENNNFMLASRNLPNIKFIDYNEINVYDVLKYKNIVFTKKGIDSLTEVLK